MICVNVKHKDFKDLQQKYNASSGTLENAIKIWLDKNNKTDYDLNDFGIQNYLDSYFKVSSNNVFTNKKDYEKAHKIWEETYQKLTTNGALVSSNPNNKNILVSIFGKDNVISYENNEGTYSTRVAEPILKDNNNKIWYRGYALKEDREAIDLDETVGNTAIDYVEGFDARYHFTSNKEEAEDYSKNRIDTSEVTYMKDGKVVTERNRHYTGNYAKVSSYQISKDAKIVNFRDIKDYNKNKDKVKDADIIILEKSTLWTENSEMIVKKGKKDLIIPYTEDNLEDSLMNNDLNSLESAERLVNRMIEDSKQITFDSKTHTYFVNGTPVDTSVTQFIHGNIDLGNWKIPSSLLGTTTDTIVRDFFMNNIKDSYKNLRPSDLNNLLEDLAILKQHFNDKFGENQYTIVSQEFPIVAKFTTTNKDGKSEFKTMAGTMDILIYDKNGDFYIYDIKSARSGFNDKKLEGYSKQLILYKSILEAKYPELIGKIKETKVIPFKLFYPTPEDTNSYSDENGELFFEGKPITSEDYYAAPRLMSKSSEDAFIDLPLTNLNIQFQDLTADELNEIKDEMGNKSIVKSSFVQTEEDRQRSALYGNPILSATDRKMLANGIMNTVSETITSLKTSPDKINIGKIFNYLKENFYNPAARLDIDDENILDQLQVAYDNWDALVQSGYARLIMLEKVTVVRSNQPIIDDDIDPSIELDNESGTIEEKEKEHYQLSLKQVSAKSSLSQEIKRTLERLRVVDDSGNPVKDKYGQFVTVDSDLAINSIFAWTQGANTIEDIEEILTEKSEYNLWLKPVLDKIKDEPFRSMFYTNFQKQSIQYSTILVENNEKGEKAHTFNLINTKEASKTLLTSVNTAFKEGLMPNIIIVNAKSLIGEGKVNLSGINEIKEVRDELMTSLSNTFYNKRIFRDTLFNSIPNFVSLLGSIGINITEDTLRAAFAKDASNKQIAYTQAHKILTEINFMLDTMKNNADRTDYNPLNKTETVNNVYGNYRNISNILSKYIMDSIEPSTYENNKMYYAYTVPSYMSKLITKLKNTLGNEQKFKAFIEEEFGSYKWFKGDTWNNEWLRLLDSSKEMRDALEYTNLLNYDKTDYVDLSELGYTMSLISAYFYAPNTNYAWYRVPILSNKPSSEFVKFKKYSGANYKESMTKLYKKVFNQEIMRIKTVLERAANNKKTSITNFDISDKILNQDSTLSNKLKSGQALTNTELSKLINSGAAFKFLTGFNNDIKNNTSLGQMIVDKVNGVTIDELQLDTFFTETFQTNMAEIVKSEIAKWESTGIFDLEELGNGNNKTYRFKYINERTRDFNSIKAEVVASNKNLSNKELTSLVLDIMKNEAITNLENYVWNDMFATINLIQLTVTDLAYYKNVEDFQKRYAQIHSPAIRVNPLAVDPNGIRYSADGNSRTIYLKDEIIKSDIIPNVDAVFTNRINATTNPVEKTHLKQMKALILTSLEKVNVTDGQGYSSPTSYRKKMGMSGKFNPQMEIAYNRIKSGNYDINDLGIVWQPLKPFVYTQTRKTSYADSMSELKVAIQNKNSEYLLILADAIIRGGNQPSKLTAIFDFMEETAYDGRVHSKGQVINEGVYNGLGIDTVQFESAVKSGQMGAIDINKLTSYKGIKEALHSSVYINADKLSDADNNMDRYDDRVVHTFTYDDYGLQQEVPNHFSDHEQLRGSQHRILSVSDITTESSFNIGKESLTGAELQTEYQELLAANIRDSFDQLIKDFNIQGTKIERNKALSDILVKAILSDQRYGADLLRACSLDANGEFIIPPSDSIQSSRIQQLLNSIIKSRINKQKTKGGPVVQTTSFGLSDDLKIVWKNKDGKKLLSKEMFAKKVTENTEEAYAKYVAENLDSVSHFEAYAPIPSKELEDALTLSDGSRMSLDQAVSDGIIPESMRYAIGYRIPTEDKYSMIPVYIKDFVPKAAGEALILPKEITLLSGSDFDIDKIYLILKSFKANVYDKAKARKDFIKEDKLIASLFNENLEDPIKFTEWFNSHPNKEDYRLPNKVFTEIKYNKDFSIKDNTKEQRDNRAFDLQWAVLTHQDTMHKMFNPGSFDNLKKLAKIVNIIKGGNKTSLNTLLTKNIDELDELLPSSSNLDITRPSSQVYFHQQNMVAAKLIGIIANHNTSHAFLSMQDIHFNILDEFTFDGYRVSNESNNRVDPLHSKNGALVSKTIASFLSASVDAVKDPVLNFLNLNSLTTNPGQVLIRLGFDETTVALFLTQPSLEKLSKEYFKRSNEGYVDVGDVIIDELKKLGISGNLFTSMSKDLVNVNFNQEELVKGIQENNTEFQARVLLLFHKLHTMGQNLNTLTFITKFNSVTNAVGPTIADTLVMSERYNKFIEDMDSIIPPFSPSAKEVVNNSPLLKSFYDTTIGDRGAARLLFKDYFPHYSDKFQEILAFVRAETKSTLDAKTINSLVNDFMVFKLTAGDTPIINGSFENRNKFINKEFITNFKESTGELNNNLIKAISIKTKDAKCPVSTLEAKTGGYSANTQESIKDSWSNLILNPETKQLGLDLFYYNVFRSGFGFSPKTFLHLASVDTKQSIPGYIESIKNTSFNENRIMSSTFIEQYKRNHSTNTKLVPTLKESSEYNINFGINIKGNKTIEINFTESGPIGAIVLKRNSFETNYFSMITYNKKLYSYVNHDSNSVTYEETTTLGNPHNFLEYNAKEDSNMRSVLSQENIASEEAKNDPVNIPNIDQLSLEDALVWVAREVFTPEEIAHLQIIAEEKAADKVKEIITKHAAESVTEISEALNKILDKFC